jgi:NAD-dependent DNA ligase
MNKMTEVEMIKRIIELKVLRHRYLYYIKNAPVISDQEYDELEKFAQSILPETSVVFKVGSDLEKDYPSIVKHEK